VGDLGSREEGRSTGLICTPFLFSFLSSLCKGGSYPRLAHSALPKAEDLFCMSLPAELIPFVYSFFGHIPLGTNGVVARTK
jgi:hypothetical protein